MPSNRTRRWRAPGRVNIIGEHIDYLGGTVLPFACDLELVVEAAPTDGTIDFGDRTRPIVDGVIAALREAGTAVVPCSGEIASSIPIGAGLSSSSALACALSFALTGGVHPDPATVLRAEEIATGVPGGLMDQTAILGGRAGHALLLDCATGSVEHVAIPDQIRSVLIDTGTRRRLADGRYAQRRAEVEAGDRKRVRHAETEQRRVYDAVDALRAADATALGAILTESHRSLRDDFEVSSDALDRAVEIATSVDGCTGARLVGAGFAGCVLAVTEAGAEERVAACFESAWVVHAVDGAGEI
ncbi:MAG: galactokinase family protein [Actinomycetota bacterium]